MDSTVLDTKLHTRYCIFLYTLRLELAMLTKRVYLDAADAERLVRFRYYTGDVDLDHRIAGWADGQSG